MGGSSLMVMIAKYAFNNFENFFVTFKIYIILYFVTVSSMSLIYIYYKAPFSNCRLIKFIFWVIRILSLICIYIGVSYNVIIFFVIILTLSLFKIAKKLDYK